jgi:hypothetical protein
MARPTRNEARRLSASVEAGLPDLTEITISEAAPGSEFAAIFEALNLGHAGRRIECWAGVGGMASGGYRAGSVALRPATRRSRRLPRSRKLLHCVRPSQSAEARFTTDDCEFLAY